MEENKNGKSKKTASAINKKDLIKLSYYIVIVQDGLSGSVTRLLRNLGVSATFIQKGRGTATRQVGDILGIEDNNKEIIYSIVRSDKVPDIANEMRAFFAINKRNRGIALSIPLSGIISMKMYSFFADAL